MHRWAAEIAVDEARVRGLIASQFPQLELRSVRLLAEGWDNSVWLVDERWAFRFPRRAVAVAGLERELEVLPRLAPLLPLPIPVPVFRGRPADGYPWAFFGGALLAGREASAAALGDRARARLAGPLGAFLCALHAPQVVVRAADRGSLPVDPFGRGDMARRVPHARSALTELERLGLWRTPASLAGALEAARGLAPSAPVVLAHGDLHFRHLLVDAHGALTGVIDWGDLCRAAPAIDLQLVWSFLPAAARPAFLAAYGPVAEAELLRARVVAVFLCATLAAYGHHEGMAGVEREAIGGLARAAPDWRP